MILLSGPSSAGKSSIGRALLSLLADPWFLVPVDAINAMRATVHRRPQDDGDVAEMLRRTRLGYHRAVAALASVGNDVIMDYPLSEPWRLDDLVDVLAPYDVTLVEVTCAAGELDRRERARGDRPAGLARSQSRSHPRGGCDITIDTTDTSPEEGARTLADQLAALAPPKAFDRLRAAALSSGARATPPPASRTPTGRPTPP